MSALSGKVAWVTGAGSGVGEAAALALAEEGAAIALSGRRRAPLQAAADRIAAAGGKALVLPGDLGKPESAPKIVAAIVEAFGRLDILVNNAGGNVLDRSWAKAPADNHRQVLEANLDNAFYCAAAALPVMRAQKDGVLIHTASWAGRWPSLVSGPAYSAAKSGVVAMSHTINMEEFVNGIRSTVLCPNEIATPILDRRPVPVPPEDRARMIQPRDMADLILYIAKLPAHVCLNEVVISPTWNRGYAAALGVGRRIA
ncbi:MAG TPA: SDR family NAD(P)-dependent oxidoreductase [Xanthobacteraceae bacterium]|nr:SDR family NAD(P)-dependent oxidoreductase [Xanthobacteraceae bacterium]